MGDAEVNRLKAKDQPEIAQLQYDNRPKEVSTMSEARLEDGTPQTAGWFVLSAREAPWVDDGLRTFVKFGGQGDAHFDDLGVGLYWLEPGRPMSLYHHEAGQEDFLVLRGRCLLIVEGEERALAQWDLVHCPPRTPHTIVGAGDEPALVLAVGARKEKGSARYPADPVAQRHGAGVARDTADAGQAYAEITTEARRVAPPDLS
jgi:uncharacterized cupin superfamily protein